MNDVSALFQDALALHRNGQLDAAEQRYRSVLAAAPGHARAWHFLGLLLHLRRQYQAAIEHLETALTLDRTQASYLNNYGVALQDVGRLDEAKNAFQQALDLAPRYADAHSNLGLWFLLRGDFPQAETSLLKALQFKPHHADASKHLAELRFRQGSRYAAREQFSKANRTFHEAASLRQAQVRPPSVAGFRATPQDVSGPYSERQPSERPSTWLGDKDIWRFKSLGFCPTVFPDQQSLDAYWTQLDRSLDFALDAGFPVDWRTLPFDGFIPSFHLPHHGRCCKAVREKFARLFTRHFPQERPARKTRNRFRIGFHVFAGHEGGFLRGTSGLIERLDRKRFDVVVLCPDRAVERFRRVIHSDDVTYVPLGGSFEQVARQARNADCDLIYYRKAGSDPWSYFLPFTRPAPVQCTSYGTHGTSGIPVMDFFLSSRFVEPEDAQRHYTERLVCLDAMPTYQRRHAQPEQAERGEFQLPSHNAVYFCPHRASKYHPAFDPIFRRLLDGDPTGRLVLLTGRDSRGNAVLHERLRRNLGTARLKRVSFFPALPFDQYLRLLAVSTMIIDSPEYAGGLTSFDAFSLGVPEVTISGPLHVQNFATGIYRRMGLGDLPCRSVDEYVDLALRLGQEPKYRQTVSERILVHNAAIFEDADTVSEHERVFDQMLSCR